MCFTTRTIFGGWWREVVEGEKVALGGVVNECPIVVHVLSSEISEDAYVTSRGK
jgi:hypothetical protein